MLMSRVGGPGGSTEISWGGTISYIDDNAYIFGHFVTYGYFYILLVQLIGVAMGDKSSVQVS